MTTITTHGQQTLTLKNPLRPKVKRSSTVATVATVASVEAVTPVASFPQIHKDMYRLPLDQEMIKQPYIGSKVTYKLFVVVSVVI